MASLLFNILDLIRSFVSALFQCIFSKFSNTSSSIIDFRRSGIRITNITTILGEGAFSTVFIGVGSNKKKYAVKKMFLQSEEFEKAYQAEVSSFSLFRHPNIMCLLDAQVEIEKQHGQGSVPGRRIAYLVFPLMKGTLRDQINATVLSTQQHYSTGNNNNHSTSSSTRLHHMLNQFRQICLAFQVLHSATPHAYVHQDVKPENILMCTSSESDNTNINSNSNNKSKSNNNGDTYALSRYEHRDVAGDVEMAMLSSNSKSNDNSDWAGCQPLLTDFGSVRLATVHIANRSKALEVVDEAASYCTVSYRAPELFDPPTNSTIDTRTDVWGIGCLLFAMWFGYSPYECDFHVDERGQCQIKVADCSHSRVLSKMPRKPEKYCTAEDVKVMNMCEWILEHDFTKRVYTSDIITAVEEELHQQQQLSC